MGQMKIHAIQSAILTVNTVNSLTRVWDIV